MTLRIKDVQETVHKVTGQLLDLKRPENESELEGIGDGAKIGYFPRDFGMEEWDWPQGVGLFGLKSLSGQDGFPDYHTFLKEWAEDQRERGLPLKNINTTAPLLTLMDVEGTEQLALEWADWIMEKAPRTERGGLQHVTSGATKNDLTMNDGQVWIDTLFMVVLFLGKMGIRYDRKEWKEEAVRQFLLHIELLFSEGDGLFYHGFDFNGHHRFSEAYWCRGNSWFTLAAPEFLAMMEGQLDDGTYKTIAQTYKAQVDKLVKLQAQDGLWHTLLDDQDSYTEVSGSSSIAAGILKGIRYGLLDGSYLDVCRRAVDSILQEVDDDGTVLKVSAGTAIGASKEDYKNIIIAPTAYGQALAIVLFSEVLQHEKLVA